MVASSENGKISFNSTDSILRTIQKHRSCCGVQRTARTRVPRRTVPLYDVVVPLDSEQLLHTCSYCRRYRRALDRLFTLSQLSCAYGGSTSSVGQWTPFAMYQAYASRKWPGGKVGVFGLTRNRSELSFHNFRAGALIPQFHVTRYVG